MSNKLLNLQIQNITIENTNYSNINYLMFLLLNNIEDKFIIKLIKNGALITDDFIYEVIKTNKYKLFKKLVDFIDVNNTLFINGEYKNLLEIIICLDSRERFLKHIINHGFEIIPYNYDLGFIKNCINDCYNSKKSYTKILNKNGVVFNN